MNIFKCVMPFESPGKHPYSFLMNILYLNDNFVQFEIFFMYVYDHILTMHMKMKKYGVMSEGLPFHLENNR